MPPVMVGLRPGRDEPAKRRIVEGITRVFEKESIPRDAVTVTLHEIPRNNWAEGGKFFSD